MISTKKFLQQAPMARLRKLWRFCCIVETELRNPDTNLMNLSEAAQLLLDISRHSSWPELFASPDIAQKLKRKISFIFDQNNQRSLVFHAVNELKHALASLIGKEAAEWDLLPPLQHGDTPAPTSRASAITINSAQTIRLAYLDNIRSPFNIGSIFRTAEAFGFTGIILSPDCPPIDHPRLMRSAMGTTNWLSHEKMTFDEAVQRFQLPVFAIELGGIEMTNFRFPQQGIAVLGSEELGVHPDILDYCRKSSGIVSIALTGSKASLNVGVSFGIIAASWKG